MLPHDLGAHCGLPAARARIGALHETNAACDFGLAARHFVAVARDRLARRRSYAARWIARWLPDFLSGVHARYFNSLGRLRVVG